jgi:hypothetical protein
MKQISSRLTFFYKRVFPIFWFGFLTLFMIAPAVIAWNTGQAPQPMFLIVPIFMMVFGYFMMKKLVFNLVDEVFDAGDALLVKNGSLEEQILLADISNISYAQMMNPPQVTLSLRKPTSFGEKVTFCAPTRLVPFATSPVIDDLMRRVDAARRRGAR